MSTWYLDTSAALKLILAEAESEALIDAVNTARPTLVASYLLETEVRRVVHRFPDLTQRQATDLLDRVDLYEVNPAMFTQAGLLPGTQLRSLDALHLATAIAIGVDYVVTYDVRMCQAAEGVGLRIETPGLG